MVTVRLGEALLAVALILCSLGPAAAEQVPRRLVENDEADRWRGVGSLRVAGMRACTAVLISATEAITAAHCVVDRASGRRINPLYFTLVLGQRRTSYAAVRKVKAVAFLPGFVSSAPISLPGGLSADLALLVLDRPVSADEASPLMVTDWPHPVGAFVDIVGYERDGPAAATIREGCEAIGDGGGVTMLACELIIGISGSPVLLSDRAEDPPHLVASVSAQSDGTSFVVPIAPHLAELRELIAGRAID